MSKTKHTTVRLSEAGRERLDRLAASGESHAGIIEAGLELIEHRGLEYRQKVVEHLRMLDGAIRTDNDGGVVGLTLDLATLIGNEHAAAAVAIVLREIHEQN